MNAGSGSRALMIKLKKFTAENKLDIFGSKIAIYWSLDHHKVVQAEKPSALKREHPPLENMKFLNFVSIFWVIFALLDPGPNSGSGFTNLIESGSEIYVIVLLLKKYLITFFYTWRYRPCQSLAGTILLRVGTPTFLKFCMHQLILLLLGTKLSYINDTNHTYFLLDFRLSYH